MEEKNKLQTALAEIKTLRGIIPIYSHCMQKHYPQIMSAPNTLCL